MENKYISVQYVLTSPNRESGIVETIEKTSPGEPFSFVSGMGMALDLFEEKLVGLEKGDKFEIIIPEDQAYGAYVPEGVHDLPADAFKMDGKLDSRYVYEGAIVPLQDPDGQQFSGVITKIQGDTITVDLNHPLAGRTLTFTGTVEDVHMATNQEIQDAVSSMSGGCGGCGGGACGEGGCGHCGGGCCH